MTTAAPNVPRRQSSPVPPCYTSSPRRDMPGRNAADQAGTFHCSFIPMAPPPCSSPISLLAPLLTSGWFGSGKKAHAGRGAAGCSPAPPPAHRAPKGREVSTLKRTKPLLQSSGWKEFLSPPKAGESGKFFPFAGCMGKTEPKKSQFKISISPSSAWPAASPHCPQRTPSEGGWLKAASGTLR